MDKLRGILFSLAVVLLLSVASFASADVGDLPVPGGSITPGDKTDSISMEYEKVEIDISPDASIAFPETTEYKQKLRQGQYYAHITAYFEMKNLTDQLEHRQVMFPFHYSFGVEDYERVGGYTNNVSVEVDGVEVSVNYQDLSYPRKSGDTETLVSGVFEVDMAADSITVIEISYDLLGIHNAKSPSIGFQYMMETGSHWAGTIGRGEIVVSFWEPVDSSIVLSHPDARFVPRDGDLVWEFTDLEPTVEDNIDISFTPDDVEAWVNEDNSLRSLPQGSKKVGRGRMRSW